MGAVGVRWQPTHHVLVSAERLRLLDLTVENPFCPPFFFYAFFFYTIFFYTKGVHCTVIYHPREYTTQYSTQYVPICRTGFQQIDRSTDPGGA
jgi:hypothetical protein